MSIELLDANHLDAIINAFEKTKQQIRIISPFIQDSMTKHLINSLNIGVKAQLITRFYREDFIRSVSSLTALKLLLNTGTEIYTIKDLHAKLYLFDDRTAIIGSANFTGGGFGNNIELSLFIQDEYDLIEQLSVYYNQLLNHIQSSGNYKIDDKKIEEEALIVQKIIKGRDHTSKPNPARFGAEQPKDESETNPIDEVGKILEYSDKIVSAVLKFEGSSENRVDSNDKYKPQYYKHRDIYFTASPVNPRSITSETTVFLSVVSRDKSGVGTPIIVGRAKTKGYEAENIADSKFLAEHPGAEDYPYYVEIYDIETVDTKIINCISLNDLIAEVGYRLYPNTENLPMITIRSLRTRHYQKPYITITSYAASRLNTMLNSLFTQYGKIFN